MTAYAHERFDGSWDLEFWLSGRGLACDMPYEEAVLFLAAEGAEMRVGEGVAWKRCSSYAEAALFLAAMDREIDMYGSCKEIGGWRRPVRARGGFRG